MEKVYEGTGVCPVCGRKTFHVRMFKYDLPVEGPSILFVGRCESCGARISDVIPLEFGEEKEVKFHLPEDLNKLLYLPGDAEIEVRPLGITMRLTPAFKGRITTVEGILHMISDDVSNLNVKEQIASLISGKERGEIIVKDKSGLLKIIDL